MGASDYAHELVHARRHGERRLHDGQLLHRARPAKADPVHQGGPAGQARPPSVGEPVGRSRVDDGQQPNMKSDAQTLGAHALYMARFVEEYAKEGLKIEAIHPQNEPGYAQVHWTQSLFINFIKTYLGPTFAQRNLTAEIWCGTMSKDPDDTNIAKAIADRCGGAGVRQGLRRAVEPAGRRRRRWRRRAPSCRRSTSAATTTSRRPYWDQSRYNASMPQNDHLYGEESWQLIRDWIVAGVNSYSAWNMVLDTVGKSLDNWPQNALLVVDRSAKKLIVDAGLLRLPALLRSTSRRARRASGSAAAPTRSPSRTPTAASSWRSTTRAPRRRRRPSGSAARCPRRCTSSTFPPTAGRPSASPP